MRRAAGTLTDGYHRANVNLGQLSTHISPAVVYRFDTERYIKLITNVCHAYRDLSNFLFRRMHWSATFTPHVSDKALHDLLFPKMTTLGACEDR
jgi:hypothetical protein